MGDHQQQWRDYMWRWYAHDCSIENQVAYPGCIDWMPDDCLNVGTGEIRPECYATASINQACKDIAVATGCNEKAYEITTVLLGYRWMSATHGCSITLVG